MVVRQQGTVYDRIGAGYVRGRRPDPRIEAAVHRALGAARRLVNVGAGTGSYEPAGPAVVAVEPSPEMIRQRRPGSSPCVRAVAEQLPFRDRSFDAAMAILTLHHWSDQERGLREMRRVADAAVILTFDPVVHDSFWLFRDYVPAITGLPSTAGVLSVDRIADIVDADRVVPVPVPADCRDGFGTAFWRRPAAYLDPRVRRCISGFGLLDTRDVEPGIERLRADLESGTWAARYGNLLDLDAFDGGMRLIIREQP